MRLTSKVLRQLIREEYESFGVGERNPKRFLHDEDADDSEGGMAKGQLMALCKMAEELSEILQENDQLPGWVQNHITVSHENLRQVHGYLMGVEE